MNAARDSPARLGVLDRTEKICATENAVSLGQTEGDLPDGEGERSDTLKPFSAENATTEVHRARVSPANPMRNGRLNAGIV
jgi:hypothetical protein